MTSIYILDNMDISGLFQSRTTETITNTNVFVINKDLGDLYKPFATGNISGNLNLFYNTNIFIKGVDMGQLLNPTILLTNGLIHHYNFTDFASYTSGSTVKNLVTGIPDMTLFNNPTFQSSTQTMLFTNTNANGVSNTQCMQSNDNVTFRSVSIWYRQLPQLTTTNGAYLFDGRPSTGTENQSFIYNTTAGTLWTNCYYDGGSNITPSWRGNEYTNNTWHNVTFTATTSATGLLTIAGRFNRSECANIEIGAALVYNRTISQAENTQNYHYYRGTVFRNFLFKKNLCTVTTTLPVDISGNFIIFKALATGTNVGSITITNYTNTSVPLTFSYLVVGGGGGGGVVTGGGGGAGGFLEGNIYLYSNDTINVSVGAGGSGSGTNITGPYPAINNKGGNSSISFYTNTSNNKTAIGGGGGGSNTDGTNNNGGAGGSAGGAARDGIQGTSTPGQGNNSAPIQPNGWVGSNGGGAGENAVGSNYYDTRGGNGKPSSQPGISAYYSGIYWGGGGGGAVSSAWTNSNAGKGGLGGGGGGGSTTTSRDVATGGGSALNSGQGASVGKGGNGGANTGGGGGGSDGSNNGGNGGSGIVILACPKSQIYNFIYLVTNGLTNYYNFGISSSFPGSGTKVTNLINNIADMDILSVSNNYIYDSTNKTFKTNVTVSTSGAYLRSNINISKFNTVCVYCKNLVYPGGWNEYLFDTREGTAQSPSGNSNSYIWQGGVGDFWTKFYNAGVDTTVSGSLSSVITGDTTKYRSLTYTGSGTPTNNTAQPIYFFSKYNTTEFMNIEVLAILIYDRPISIDEDKKNYEYIKSLYPTLSFA
jgi:hypothetical protein